MRLRRVKFAFGKCYLWACKVVGVLMFFFQCCCDQMRKKCNYSQMHPKYMQVCIICYTEWNHLFFLNDLRFHLRCLLLEIYSWVKNIFKLAKITPILSWKYPCLSLNNFWIEQNQMTWPIAIILHEFLVHKLFTLLALCIHLLCTNLFSLLNTGT